jgi:hypothetical protein
MKIVFEGTEMEIENLKTLIKEAESVYSGGRTGKDKLPEMEIENLKTLIKEAESVYSGGRTGKDKLPRMREDYISLWFSRDDIVGHAENLGVELDEDEVDNVIDYFERNGDAEVGINWESIEGAINYVKEM